MSPKSFIVHIHGGLTHTVMVALLKTYCAHKGAVVKDEAVFGMKHNAPCTPDVWAVYDERIPMGGGRYRTQTANLIVEVETQATKESIARKRLQYEATLAGCNLIVLDLNTCTVGQLTNWKDAFDWFEGCLPI
jgi:hypothetical protein